MSVKEDYLFIGKLTDYSLLYKWETGTESHHGNRGHTHTLHRHISYKRPGPSGQVT